MRRMLSGLLATAMVASVCATASFAADYADASEARFVIDFTGLAVGAADAEDVEIQWNLDHGGTITLKVDNIPAGSNAEGIAEAFAKEGEWELDGDPTFWLENGKKTPAMSENDFTSGKNRNNFILRTKVVGRDVEIGTTNKAVTMAYSNAGNPFVDAAGAAKVPNVTVQYDAPNPGLLSEGDVTLEDIDLDIRNIVVCDEKGEPVPLTEKSDGVDKDQNGDDGVQSGQTVYFMIRNDTEWKFHDDTFWKMKLSKGDNGKYIKAVSDITKNFGSDLYNVYTHSIQPGSGSGRSRYIKVQMNEIFTDDEYKITLDVRLTPKSKAENVFKVDDDAELKIQDFSFYLKNIVKNADGDWRVGINGMMLNPIKNDWNEVTYYDEDGDVAFLRFFGDSNTDKFYSKLSTRWEHADYASYFNDQDAYIFQFTGSPSLSSTSRADLQIYDPYIDEDGNAKIEPGTAYIYQIIDGDLVNMTGEFTYQEGENGDMAYCTRTRFLGSIIICEKPIEEADGDDTVDLIPDDLVPGNNTGAPVEVNPGSNGGSGSKAPANTGKF